jgi:hypothetical protein
MAKRGTFGGTRFGGPGYGKAGFKRGFGRSGFGRLKDVVSMGIEEEMMKFFKMSQGGKFDQTTGMFTGPKQPQQEERLSRRRTPSTGGSDSIIFRTPSLDFLAGGGKTTDTPSKTPKPTGTPKQKPVKFKPKLTRGAR